MNSESGAHCFGFSPESGLPVDADRRQFRNALGRFPTGVAIVTCLAPEGARVGLTINSFASVSLDPPLVLWSIDKRGSAAALFTGVARFAISVLDDKQENIARAFAWPDGDPFERFAHQDGIDGVPLIDKALAVFECRREAVYPGGDHEIVLGQVERFSYRKGRPLAYHEGVFLGLPR